ncbi:unnamed protein product, partial [Mesorhabditis spiculigera]
MRFYTFSLLLPLGCFGYINVRQTIPMGTQTFSQGQSFTINCADTTTMSQGTFDQQQKVWRWNSNEITANTNTRTIINNYRQMQFVSFTQNDAGSYDCCILPYGATDNYYNCYNTNVVLYGTNGNTQYPGQSTELSVVAQLLLAYTRLITNTQYNG